MTFIDALSLPLNMEFKELIFNFTLEALINVPDNVYEFASNYFDKLVKDRASEAPKTTLFQKKVRTWISSRNASSYQTVEETDGQSKAANRRIAISSENWTPYDLEIANSKAPMIITLKTEHEKDILRRLISRVTIFKTLGDDEINDVITHMTMLMVNEKEVIIQQGDPGDHFYVIQSGVFDVYTKNDYGGLDHVSTYNNQGSFGELSLLYNSPRSATIISKTAGILWYMNRQTFRSIVIMQAHIKRIRHLNFISSLPIFAGLSKNERMNISEAIQIKIFDKDDIIFSQGEIGQFVYFIESGKVSVIVEMNHVRKQVNTLEKGQYFGELSMMTNQPRSATVRAMEKTSLGMLDKLCFERLLGPCLDVLKRNAMVYEELLKNCFKEHYKDNKV